MTDALLTLLRWCLLGLIYLFFFRVLQATWAGSRARPASRTADGAGGGSAQATPPARRERGSRRSRRAERNDYPPQPQGPRLVIIEPPSETGQEYVVNGELTIGRAAGCSITLDDTYLSQVHARVSPHENGVVVEDLGSTNGTYLNRQRVTPHAPVLGAPGNHLQIGGIVMEVR